jgi:hypothetical protein
MVGPAVRKKLGDIFSDLGKYTLTVIPITYYFSSYYAFSAVVILGIVVVGIMLCFMGILMIHSAEKQESSPTKLNGNHQKIRLMKNTTIQVEKM